MAHVFSLLSHSKLLTKIGALVAVPVVGLLLMSINEIADKRSLSATMVETSRLVDLASDVTLLVHGLQREAAASAAFVSNAAQGDTDLSGAQRSSVAAQKKVEADLGEIDVAKSSADLKAVLDDGLSKARSIDGLRSQVASRSAVPAKMNAAFTAAIVRLLDFSSTAAGTIQEIRVARAMRLYAAVMQAAEASSAARANAAIGFGAGSFDLRTYQTVLRFLNRQADVMGAIDAAADPEQRAFVTATYSGPPVDDTARMAQVMIDAGPGGNVSAVTQSAWLAVNAERMKLYGQVEKRFEDDLRATALSVKETAEGQLTTQLILSGVLLAATGLLAILVARSITRPVKELVSRMETLAAGDNLEPVPHTARRDEIGDMARSVLVFQENAVRLQSSESTAADTRRVTEDERIRSEAERATAAARQAEVVDALATGLGRLSNGHLTFRLDQAFASDYDKLRIDFNSAMDILHGTMVTVSSNTAAIRSGMGEISTASDDLSRRTEQQAASLEETAASLNEITTTVRKTAEGSRHAREVVGQAKQAAEHSGLVVRQTVEAMSGIERSSNQIGQIIGVIDEIAFQTNLLALNAGVEAARAGDAGRGFAVVASEVRALAQRSAEAAKEIKTLISASSQQVGQGVSLVDQTGHVLKQIVDYVNAINDIVADITASAQDQATGLDQINTAITQMDQVTQQNAAMVEQTTAASRSLAQKIEELFQTIAQFDIGRAAVASPSPAGERPARASVGRKLVTALKTIGRGGAASKPASDDWQEF